MNGKEVLFIAFVVFVIGMAIGVVITGETYRVRAIEKGCAEYVITNEKSGETQFMWKDEIQNSNQEKQGD